MQPQDIREKIGRFRILVVGRANAGKTTLLQRVCNTTENPEVFDGAGNKVNTAFCAHQNHLLINPIRSMPPL
jgi:GTPase SAR1 family protein